MAKYRRAVSVYLGKREDVPLAAITYNDAASWLEALAAETTFGARADYLSYVGQVYKRAQQREHIPATTVNPFRDQQHGKKSVSCYKCMPDETLVAILALLDPTLGSG